MTTERTREEWDRLADLHNDGRCAEDCGLHEEDVHGWFGLSYATHMTLERTLLQAMPGSWQRKFVALLDELDEASEGIRRPYAYNVQAVDAGGKFAPALPHYRHAPRNFDRLRELAPDLSSRLFEQAEAVAPVTPHGPNPRRDG